MPKDAWVVLKAVHPSWCTAQLPGEVAELLGCTAAEIAQWTKPARAVAFLDRGPGTLRVIGVHRSADLLSREMAGNRVVAMAQLSEKLVFNFPDAVERHLELTTYPREHSARGTDDMVIWFLPREEYYAYRAAERAGRSFSPAELPHVYLAKSMLPGLRPPVEQLERPSRMALSPVPRGR